MDIQPIHTEEEYEAALAEIELLMRTAKPDTPAERKMDALVALVERYEDEHFPIPDPDPIAALEHFLDRKGLTYKDLEAWIGSQDRVLHIMSRQQPLSMIRTLAKHTDIPVNILIQEYPLENPELVAA